MNKLVNLLLVLPALGLSLLVLAGCPAPQDESQGAQSAAAAPAEPPVKAVSPVAAVVDDAAGEADAATEEAVDPAAEDEAADDAPVADEDADEAESAPEPRGCEDCDGGECSGACVEEETVIEPEPADAGDEAAESADEDEGGCGSEGGCASCAQSATGAAPAEVPTGLTRVTLHVEGMSCAGKAGWVGKTIGGLEGVAGCYADEGTLTAVIDCDPTLWDAAGLIAEIEQRSEGVFTASQV
jgi:hypothetical protein